MSNITRDVGARIRLLRMQNGLTQEELADRANLHNTYIGQIERGEKNLSLQSLDKIIRAFGISYSQFFEPIDARKAASTIASQCYDIIDNYGDFEQQRILSILKEVTLLLKK